MSLPEIPVRDYRRGGLGAYALDRAEDARHLVDAVLRGFGPAAPVLRRLLPLADRIAARHLRRIGDPYLAEIRATRAAMGRPGALAFSLSYEASCTARVFSCGTLFRTLDWPFHGLGDRVEIVHLAGPAGPWITATWPGLAGIVQGAAPGRFAIAMNQAPERRSRLGRPGSWVAGKIRLTRGRGLPPMHLLRRVFEEAKDPATARRMLAETPIAAPAIFTLSAPGAPTVIERTETAAAEAPVPFAVNHFAAPAMMATRPGWRPRGHDSHGRAALVARLEAPPALDALPPPVLNPETRLAMTLDPAGRIAVAGYEGVRRVTRVARATAYRASDIDT